MKRRVRSNPRVVMNAYLSGTVKYIDINLSPDEYFSGYSLRMRAPAGGWSNPSNRSIRLEVSESGKLKSEAYGELDTRGGLRWHSRTEALLAEDLGSIFDRMLMWMLDPSIPPVEHEDIQYDVDI